MTVPAALVAVRIAWAVLAPVRRAIMPVVKAMFRAPGAATTNARDGHDAETEEMT